jgi:isovaleryl-CoA dehydrogenase
MIPLTIYVCLGGNGYINDFPTGRFLRDAKLYEIGAGTSEIRRMLIGREFNKEFKQ